MNEFIIKNITTKIVNIHGMNILPSKSYNLFKLDYIDKYILETSLTDGELHRKLNNNEIIVVKNTCEFKRIPDEFKNSIVRSSPTINTETINLQGYILGKNSLNISGAVVSQEITLNNSLKIATPVTLLTSTALLTLQGINSANEYITEVIGTSVNKYSSFNAFKSVKAVIPANTLGQTIGVWYPSLPTGLSKKNKEILYTRTFKNKHLSLSSVGNLDFRNCNYLNSELIIPHATTNNAIMLTKSVLANTEFVKTTNDFDGVLGLQKYFLSAVTYQNPVTRKLAFTFSTAVTGDMIIEGLDCYGANFTEKVVLSGTTVTTYACYFSINKITIPSQASGYDVTIGITDDIGFNFPAAFWTDTYTTKWNYKVLVNMVPITVNDIDFNYCYPNGCFKLKNGFQPNGTSPYIIQAQTVNGFYNPNSLNSKFFNIKNPTNLIGIIPFGFFETIGSVWSNNILSTELTSTICYETE